MKVGYHEKTGIFILKLHIVAHGPEIITQVQVSGRPDTTHDDGFFTHAANIRIDLKAGREPFKRLHAHSSKKREEAWRMAKFAQMELNKEITQKIADLARLEFDDQELLSIQKDLEQMISFVEKLNEIDTQGVAPLTHITAEDNRLREDVIKGSVDNATALMNAPSHEGPFFTVPKVINKN